MAWRDLRRWEKALVVLGVVLFAWLVLSLAINTYLGVSQGQNPLLAPLCGVSDSRNGTVGGSLNVCNQPTGSSGSSGTNPQSNVQPLNCITIWGWSSCIGSSQVSITWQAITNAISAAISNLVNQLPGIILSTIQNAASTVFGYLTGPLWSWVSTIGATIEGDIFSFGQTIGNAADSAISAVLSALATPFQWLQSAANYASGAGSSVASGVGTEVQQVQNFASGAASPFGPFAPVVTAAIVGAIVVLALGLAFMLFYLLWGLGKTVFNLL